jgi:hypothetical protein
MNKVWCFIFTTFFLPSVVQAAQFGFGLSAKSDDTSIYLPVIIGKVMIEPSIRWHDFEFDFDFYKQKIKEKEFGLGVFGLHSLQESLQIYYGGRFSYVREKRTILDYDHYDYWVYSFSSKTDGYRIAPTLGFQYFIMRQLAIAGEVEWYYLNLDGKNDSLDREGKGTNTRLLARFFLR